jgi:hypothetical protein
MVMPIIRNSSSKSNMQSVDLHDVLLFQAPVYLSLAVIGLVARVKLQGGSARFSIALGGINYTVNPKAQTIA